MDTIVIFKRLQSLLAKLEEVQGELRAAEFGDLVNTVLRAPKDRLAQSIDDLTALLAGVRPGD